MRAGIAAGTLFQGWNPVEQMLLLVLSRLFGLLRLMVVIDTVPAKSRRYSIIVEPQRGYCN